MSISYVKRWHAYYQDFRVDSVQFLMINSNIIPELKTFLEIDYSTINTVTTGIQN